jgi:hypothetical protein
LSAASAGQTNARRPPDVAEGRHGVGEEHRPVAADRRVEGVRFEGVDLGVALLEGDVGDALAFGAGPGLGQHRAGQVEAQRAASGGAERREACGLPRAAAEVEDPVVPGDCGGLEERLVEAFVHGVPAVLVAGPVGALEAVPCLCLFGVDDVRHGVPPVAGQQENGRTPKQYGPSPILAILATIQAGRAR